MKPLILIFNLLCGADAATTHIALTHGAREVLLPTQNPWIVDGIVAGQAVATSTIVHRRGKTRGITILTWIAIGARGVAVANNIYQLHRQLH